MSEEQGREAEKPLVNDTPVDAEREAKLKAAAEARAARTAAKEKAEASAAETVPELPKAPSPKQPELDKLAALIKQEIAESAVEDFYLNELNGDMPILIINNRYWREVAKLLKEHEELKFNYLRNVSGVDYETHMEVVYHLLSLDSKREAAMKLRTDRDAASVFSATPVWATANWNEREIYDLLGVDFPGHPDMRRIMMPDDWVGHPLRKDYEPIDPEV
ncbi:NADH-quinone oxidoreductase subunit C [Paenibacillus sinopodophylli]|uniref:NADH-quinone oxidoreductase subunit C n=1 Tax=Paenibacillus sinopodophylli TaxID=1837342 RepID=UPI00110CFA46|nr:NADH-quinone oxidoreductase subunit C [Paenibacillus sinopodophylli]